MHRIPGTCAALLFAAMLSAQSSYQPAQAATPEEAKIFQQLRTDWASNVHNKRIDASVAMYAPDAELVKPDGTRLQGPSALRELFQTITQTFDNELVFNSKRVAISGNLAYDSGDYREVLTLRATGKRQLMTGSYLTVYQHESDGRWLIAEEMWVGPGDAALIKLDLDPHPVVALTFDDLPAAAHLPPNATRTQIATTLAAELNANHLAGTYGFVNASKLENNPDAQQSLHVWLDAGMNIGSHTWSHMSLTSNTAEAFEDDIASNEPALAQYGGKRDWHWFRYPFLWEGDTLDKRRAVRGYLRDHGYLVAQVSLDFEDYEWNDAYARCVAKQDSESIQWLRQSYLETATEYIRLGREEQLIAFGHEIPNVMLLHATAFTTLMLPDLLDLLRHQGFTFSPLAKVESDPAYALNPDAPLKYGGTLPDQFMDSHHLPYPPFQPKPFQRIQHLCQ